MTPETRACEVSTSGAAAVTVTCSSIAPGASVRLIVLVSATWTRICSWTAVLKLLNEMRTVYNPPGRAGCR
jgi:hypothetical protein